MPEQKIRFGVGAPDVPRSALWSFFWHEHDAYVSAVEAGGIAKVSFHLRTAEFSWGYTREFMNASAADLPPLKTRDFERWQRPPEYEPGLTIALRIYVANEALKVDSELPTKKKTVWIAPRSGRAVGFVFVIASPAAPAEPFSELQDLQLLGRARFSEHPDSILLFAHHIDERIVSKSANASIVEFTRLYPHAKLPDRHRMYTQTDKPEPGTGSRNLIEIPTYVLPFTPRAV